MGKKQKRRRLVIFLLCFFFFFSCSPVLIPISEHSLYIKSRVAIQSENSNLLGSLEAWSHPRQFVFLLKDSFFRPLLQFTLTNKYIIITQNKKTRKLIANKKNREKILGLSFTPIEFYAILQAKKLKGAESLSFSDNSPTPKNVVKKDLKNTIQVDYFHWQESPSGLVPRSIKIHSQSPNVMIRLAITDYKISL